MRCTVVFLLLLTCPLALWGAADNRADGWIDRATALADAVAATATVFPDADTVVVARSVHVAYAADGTYVQWHEEYRKILTERGRRANRTLSSHFTIPYQQPEDCTVPLLEVIAADGSTRTIDVAAQQKVMTDPSSMGSNIYNPNRKIRRINVPGLGVGDTLHMVFFDRIVKPRMVDTFGDFVTFEGTAPIVRADYTVLAPTKRPLSAIALKDPVADTVSYERAQTDTGIRHRWSARDVPRMFPEPNMPPTHTVVQRLLVSTAPDWETVSRWYWDLSAPHLEPSPAMETTVADLIAGLSDRRARIEAIFRYVSEKIRYMGITVEATAPGYEPHDVADTFAQQHGVCRDKAALLVAMLRLAGYEAFPTLIHTGTKKDPEVPQPFFNHAITAVRQDDGSYLLMDPTDETTKELLPAYLNDKSYLVATPEGTGLRTSPIVPATENLLHIDTSARITAAGALEATCDLRFAGINDNAYRGYFARIRPEERRRYFAGLVKALAAGAEMTDYRIEPADMTDRDTPLRVRLRFTAPDVAVAGEDLALLPLPLIGSRAGMVNFIIGRTGLERRDYPFETGIACGVHERLELSVDPALGTIIAPPRFSPAEAEGIAWRLTASGADNQVVVSGGLRLKAVAFDPAAYRALKQVLAQVERDLRRRILLRPAETPDADATPADDITVTRHETLVEVHDAHSWSETVRVEQQVHTYAGKKRAGEIKLSANSGWESVELLQAEVVTADGSVHTVSDDEINVMDAGWVGTARRYPPTRTTVISLPAVDVGCTIRYAYRRDKRQRPCLSGRIVFAGRDPIGQRLVELRLPQEIAARLRHTTLGGTLAHSRDRDGATVIHRWQATDLARIPDRAGLPPRWAFVPTLFLSTGDWEEYAAALRSRLRTAAAVDASVEQLVTGLIAQTDAPRAKIRAIRDHVARQIRGAGPGLGGLPPSAISPAATTLADGYGNTADRAVLLHAMLSAAGFTPHFVLAGFATDHPHLRAPLLRFPGQLFGSVLVAVRPDDAAERIYLNDTDQYQALGATAHEGEPALELAVGMPRPQLCPAQTRTESHYAIDLHANGDARIEHTRLSFGNRFGARRRYYDELSPEERRRAHLEMAGAIARGATTIGPLTIETTQPPAREHFAVRVDGFAVVDGDHLYCTLPASLGATLQLRAETRDVPYYTAGGNPLLQRVVLRLPAGYAPVLLPREIDGADPLDGTLAITSAYDGEQLTVTWRRALEPSLVPAARYDDLQELQRRLRHPDTHTVVLRRTQPDAGESDSPNNDDSDNTPR